ncbi:hypothetical protein N9948_00970 [bacterium]|nr:hypothetical protein [bacterium]
MKSFLLSILILFITSCSGSTQFGECIGIADEGNPKLIYETSTRNAIWSFIGIETIIAPILWATDYAKCPIAYRDKEVK